MLNVESGQIIGVHSLRLLLFDQGVLMGCPMSGYARAVEGGVGSARIR